MALSAAGGMGSMALLLTDRSRLSDDIFKSTGEEQSRRDKPIKTKSMLEDAPRAF